MSPRTSTISYTPTSPGWPSVHPRPLGSILAHPSLDSIPAPVLPCPARDTVFHITAHGAYKLTTHLVPAAYPRLTPDIPLPEIPIYSPGASPDDRRIKMDVLIKQVFERQDAYDEGKLGGTPSEKMLWNCVNRYVRTSGSSAAGITLFLAHANGFHKEASGVFGGPSTGRLMY